MKRAERILFKLIMIHLILLLCAQAALTNPGLQPHISRVVQYEGVNKLTISEWLETFKQSSVQDK
ncbi:MULTISPECIES: DUF5359 family protein [Metabacillus]|uniref:Uncharacterized protein n=1 Tax=Metabacillus indicus TaxID=246786 RepID=A0A084H0F5_METID|nr:MULTISPECIES: DUF5359 family protein [Metabacillus]KEZ50740.1 hypothetical protein AZ46_0208815 [Metabacillus indicus LMG 22858]KEZ53067.1 hypothetical protein GS18_0209675 [Metabacillus indicus]